MKMQTYDKIMNLCSTLDDATQEELRGMLEPELDADQDKQAGDAALRVYASPAVRSVAAYQAALRRCAPVLGDASGMALDSAEAVYGAALKRLGVDTRPLLPSSFSEVFDVAMQSQSNRPKPGLSPSQASAAARKFPHLARFLGGA